MAEDTFSIELTHTQVARIVREAASREGLPTLLAGLRNPDALHASSLKVLDKPGLSHSVLRAFLVFAAFPLDGSSRAVTDIAEQLGLSASTTHRYTTTLVAIGLLERDPTTRQYRRPAV
jgi:DNA-binding MarR family transcriptional regulator